MTWLNAALGIIMVLMVLSNPVHARRTRSRNRGARSRSQASSRWWVPQVVESQVLEQRRSDPMVPANIGSRHQSQQYADPWVPQQVHSSVPQDAWLPEQIEQTKATIPWLEQRPRRGNCTFNYDTVPNDHIHSFLVDHEREEIVYPDIMLGRQVTMTSGTTVLASCPGTGNSLVINNRSYAYITCRNAQLYHGKNPVSWADLGCHKKIKPTLKSGRRCGSNSRTYYIGWDIRRRLFLRQITVCFNTKLETSVSAAHTLYGRYIDAKVVEPSRPGFKSNSMFSVSLSRSYRKRTQKSLATQVLRSTEQLSTKGQHYLAKGHLAPDADFVLEAEQDATYYYINAVPQWQAVNNGNWKSLEFAVREMAERRQATFNVYTGTHGILELPDLHQHPTKMYLGKSSDKEVVPVPALLWKVIHDPATHTAVAFVVINDVTDRASADSWSLRHQPCRDACSFLRWVDWDITDATAGLTFCCTVDALRSTIPNIPDLGRVHLLV